MTDREILESILTMQLMVRVRRDNTLDNKTALGLLEGLLSRVVIRDFRIDHPGTYLTLEDGLNKYVYDMQKGFSEVKNELSRIIVAITDHFAHSNREYIVSEEILRKIYPKFGIRLEYNLLPVHRVVDTVICIVLEFLTMDAAKIIFDETKKGSFEKAKQETYSYIKQGLEYAIEIEHSKQKLDFDPIADLYRRLER